MEETIGYEALFSAEEWDAIRVRRSGPVRTIGALRRRRIAASSTACTIDDPPGQLRRQRGPLRARVRSSATYIGAADTEPRAQAIARLHEAFVATLVEKLERGRDEDRDHTGSR